MYRIYRHRIYPTENQAVLIDRHISACRLVYNLALETKIYAYRSHGKNLSAYDLHAQLVGLKKDCTWLYEVGSQSLQRSISDLDVAFKNFFKRNSGFPLFKKKKEYGSFTVPTGSSICISDGRIYIPKFLDGIKAKITKPLIGVIRKCTLIKTPTGKFFVAILLKINAVAPAKKLIEATSSIGIDLGLTHFVITSDGVKIDNPKYYKKIKSTVIYLQRQLSKKKKGSNNRKKAIIKLALRYEKINNQKRDFLHKLSADLINNHDTICLEKLNIKGMVKNHKLAGAISGAGWGRFVQMLKYKAEWSGKNILQIPPFEPSTKICSSCGVTNSQLTLKDREWTCECGMTHDRDINAAINIKNYFFKQTPAVCGKEPVELVALATAKKQEDFINQESIHTPRWHL